MIDVAQDSHNHDTESLSFYADDSSSIASFETTSSAYDSESTSHSTHDPQNMSIFMASSSDPVYDISTIEGLKEAQFDLVRKASSFCEHRINIYLGDTKSKDNNPDPSLEFVASEEGFNRLFRGGLFNGPWQPCEELIILSGSVEKLWNGCLNSGKGFSLLHDACSASIDQPKNLLQKFWLFFKSIFEYSYYIHFVVSHTTFDHFDIGQELRLFLSLYVATQNLVHDLLHYEVTTRIERRNEYRTKESKIRKKMEDLEKQNKIVEHEWRVMRADMCVAFVYPKADCEAGDFETIIPCIESKYELKEQNLGLDQAYHQQQHEQQQHEPGVSDPADGGVAAQTDLHNGTTKHDRISSDP